LWQSVADSGLQISKAKTLIVIEAFKGKQAKKDLPNKPGEIKEIDRFIHPCNISQITEVLQLSMENLQQFIDNLTTRSRFS